jgi:hypothetical protein
VDTVTMNMRGRRVTHDEALKSAHRLINSHFRNPDSARCSIPVDAADDDVTIIDYIHEQMDAAHSSQLSPPVKLTSLQMASIHGAGMKVYFAAKKVLEMFTGGYNPNEEQLGRLDGALLGFEYHWTPGPTEEKDAASSHLSPEVAEDDIELELSQAVRLELFMSHACYGVYGDDGEMQCNVIPAIDFKRNFPSEILAKCAIHRLIRAKLAAPTAVNPEPHPSPASPNWETACVGLDESDLIPSDEQAVRQVYPHAFKAAETIWNAPGWASNYAIGDSWADARSKLPAEVPLSDTKETR